MHVASRNGHFKVVIRLLEAKADVNMKTNVSHNDDLCYSSDSIIKLALEW